MSGQRPVRLGLDAIVHPGRGRSWACRIRNFTDGAMLLEGSDATGRSLRDSGVDVRVDDEVHVQFAVAADGARQNFRISARVARVLDDALAVQFPDGMALRPYRALEAFARDAGEGGAAPPETRSDTLDPEVARSVRAAIRSTAARALPQLFSAFFERAQEELIVLARDAGTSARQNMLFEALNAIERSGARVAEEATEAVVGQIDEVVDPSTVDARRRERESQDGGGLALVDTEQFEDWLALADIVSKAENRFGEELTALCLRLSLIARPWGEKDVIPLGPTVIAHAFDGAMREVAMERDVRQLVYSYFRDALVAFLRKLYPAIEKILEDSGAFPSLETIASAARRRARPTPQRPRPSASESSVADEPVADSVGDPVGGAVGGPEHDYGFGDFGSAGPVVGGPAGGAPVAGGHPRPAPAQIASGRGAPAMPQIGGYATTAPMGNVYGAARELVQLRRGLPGPDGLPTEMPWAADTAPGNDSVFAPEEVLRALDQLERGGRALPSGERQPIQRRLQQVLERSGSEKTLGPRERDALEVVDSLIGTIQNDAYIPDSVKDWLGGLEVTFGKLAAQNVDFLDTSAQPLHPALRLLNELADLGNAGDAGEGLEPALRGQVDQVLARLAQDYDGDPSAFEQALSEIEPISEKQRRAFESNVRRVVRQSEGASKLVNARRTVVGEMDARLGDREVPQLLIDLLNPGWRNLLVHTLLRHGADSEQYRENLGVVDSVMQALETGEGDVEALVDRVERGLDDIAFEPGRRRPLMQALRRALAEPAPVERVHVHRGASVDLLGLRGQVPDAEPALADEDPKAKARWEEALAIARALEVGNWVSVDDDAGRTRILSVAWIGEDHSAFTLVNRKGVKVHDLELRAFVEGLVEDRIEVLDAFDMPLMERASQAMLQNMHNQLTYQATHDALTGLVNRKEFEQAVTRAVTRAQADGSEHAVFFMDLDQFKIVNNTAGHDAGDELLRAVVPNLRHELRGVRSTLARLGGDEFGVLVERADREASLAVAEAMLSAVRDFRFEWQDREFSLTGSLGFVPFGNDERDAATLLQQADAACYAAKEEGRNRIRVAEQGDAAMAARRDVMEWVPKVDQLLKDGRIRLTAQRIAPLRDPEGSKPHYEILMTVLDDDGKPMPPIEFITAAETYDRMPAVDRWIVGHALSWMALNLSKLDGIDGFSINLSGTSLNDPGFLDYVVQQIQKTRVPTRLITFEITETAAVGSMEGAQRFMDRLRALGCTFSLDDFGTGLSSYSYLRNLDVDYVKIDGVFVKDLVKNPADYAVVKSVNEIAHFMGKKTIAEFVENDEIMDALREIGVDYGQGWGIERPIPLDHLFPT